MPTKTKKQEFSTYTVLRSLVIWQQIEVDGKSPEEVRAWALRNPDHQDWQTTKTSADSEPVIMRRRSGGGYDILI